MFDASMDSVYEEFVPLLASSFNQQRLSLFVLNFFFEGDRKAFIQLLYRAMQDIELTINIMSNMHAPALYSNLMRETLKWVDSA